MPLRVMSYILFNMSSKPVVTSVADSSIQSPTCDLRGNFVTFWEGGKKTNRKTEQKMAVLRALYTSKEHHLTVEQLFKLVKRQLPTISETTVYRTLSRLVDEGLAVRMQLLPEVDHYERVREPHAHVVCDQCQQITEAPLVRPATVNRLNNYQITHTDVTYHGVCNVCRQVKR